MFTPCLHSLQDVYIDIIYIILLFVKKKMQNKKAFSPPFIEKNKNENTKKEGAKAVSGPGTGNLFLCFHYKTNEKEVKKGSLK